MITRIQTRHFRSLKGVDQRLEPFQALVGPNASGKTTFLDVVAFFGDLMRNRGNLIESLESRSASFEQLLWKRQGNAFQLAIEAMIPQTVRDGMAEDKQNFTHVRYEMEVGLNTTTNQISFDREELWLIIPELYSRAQLNGFPSEHPDRSKVLERSGQSTPLAIRAFGSVEINYVVEGTQGSVLQLTPRNDYSLITDLPLHVKQFPVAIWFREMLERGIQSFTLNSQTLRQPGPPGKGLAFFPDGSNLPWVIARLRRDTERFQDWLDHVRTALEDIHDIDTIERPEDKHRYLVIEYKNGARVPSWLASDGTLRLLALTIPAYLPDLEGTFLIEEPENGIHPRGIETVLQSLSSMYRSQVLIATHSPIALNMLQPNQILCFAKDSEGATDIVSGDRHPALRTWQQGQPDLGVLFASGILS